ncbi:MAG: hypothetical protein IJY39_12255 [Clostridia bacterium]|nr:hypothetical protein [Clostridia bacterium]
MTKRIIALFLCLASLVAVFSGCAGKIDSMSEYKGQQITMYLTENVYDLDPAHAYINEATRTVVSLLFDTLFVLDENGKVKPSLAKGYTIEEDPNADEYFMYIELNDSNWSDNTPVTADDVVYAWKRVLSYKNSYETASLLFDIKNARAYNEGEVSKDDIGLTADGKLVSIQFEKPIDYDQFILNLTSLALAPLRESIVEKSEDWAKKPGTMVCSGPFKLARISFSANGSQRYDDTHYDVSHKIGDKTYYIEATEPDDFKESLINNFVLERNVYYYRNSEKDENLDKSVTPYRIVVDCAMSDEDIKEAYEGGTILYIGDIPVCLRNDFKDVATVKDSLSTNVLYFNHNAEINGEKLFAIKEVRQALSMAIDRDAIAEALVFAEAATGLVPTGVFDTNSIDTLFRDASTANFKYLTKNIDEAKALLKTAGIDPSDYSFSLTYPAYDEVHTLIAEAVVAAWNELGFDVELNKRGTVANNDYYKLTDSVPTDICDDLYAEDFRNGDFEVIILDMVAVSVDPFSVLAPFAKQFSGQGMDMSVADHYELTPHITGYNSEEYNAVMEEVFVEKTIENRSAKLHEAEAILMEDMPVIPVVFNKTAYVVNDTLKLNNKTLFWKSSSNYYGADTLKKISVKDYEGYLATCTAFLESKYDEYRANPLSYFGSESFREMPWEQFKEESSNYAYLFKPIITEVKEEDD